MATPLKPPKPGVIDLEEDNDDDLWNFNSPCSSQAPQEPAATVLSSGSDDDDDLKSLPAHKRRRLQRLQRLGRLRSPAKDRGSGGEGSGGSSDVEVVATASAPAAKPKQPDEFDLLLQPSKARLALRQRSAAEGAAAAAALLRNQQALACLRAQLAAPVPELPEPPEEEEAGPVQPPEASASEPEEEEAGGERIVVKLRTQQQAEPVKLRIGAAAPFERMFQTFRAHAQAKGWVQPGTQLRFLFDGDQLSGTDTAAGADVEDDCVIEVHW